VPALPDLPDG